jgi:hypothetical protein
MNKSEGRQDFRWDAERRQAGRQSGRQSGRQADGACYEADR